eukprot:3875477-Pleurochrysis_carterae.AAC.1
MSARFTRSGRLRGKPARARRLRRSMARTARVRRRGSHAAPVRAGAENNVDTINAHVECGVSKRRQRAREGACSSATNRCESEV